MKFTVERVMGRINKDIVDKYRMKDLGNGLYEMEIITLQELDGFIDFIKKYYPEGWKDNGIILSKRNGKRKIILYDAYWE